MTSYTFWAELVRDGEDVEVEVQYTCTPFIPATHTQPAEGGEIEILNAWIDGDTIDLTDAEESLLIQLAGDRAESDMADDDADRGDYLYEQARDRRALGDD